MNFLNGLLLVKKVIKTKAKMKMRTRPGVKAQKIGIKELLLSVRAFGKLPANSLLSELTDRKFWFKLQQKQDLKAILIAKLAPEECGLKVFSNKLANLLNLEF